MTVTKNHFDHKAIGFSTKNAVMLGGLAEQTYEKDLSITSLALMNLGFETISHFQSGDTQCFIAEDEDIMVLAFRGTENLADVMTDLDIDLVAGAGGKLHEGFNTALSLVWRDILKYIKEEREGRSLWVTGHSLGAALATIAVARLRLEKDEPVNGLYTFGQPRTGDREFARNFNADFGNQTFRFVNNNDIVTRVPFRSMGYSHVGTFKYFNEDGKFRHQMVWWKKLLDRIKGRLYDVLERGTDGIKDHSISEYVSCLENNFYHYEKEN